MQPQIHFLMTVFMSLMKLVLIVIVFYIIMLFIQEQRSKLFNGSVGYEFDDKLYKSLYDVCYCCIKIITVSII